MKRRIRSSVASASVPYQVSDNQIARDNSAYWDDKNKKMKSHPDVGKQVRVDKKGDDLYRKSYRVAKVDGDTYYLDLGNGSTASYKKDDLYIKAAKKSSDDLLIGPYGLYDVYRMIRGKAPDDWWAQTEIEMDFGDGIKLAKNLARKKGLEVRVNPSEELWYVPGQYYWTDCYFYPYPYGHEMPNHKIFTCNQITKDPDLNVEVIQASEEAEDDLTISQQEFTSEKTSINSQKLPAIYKMIHIPAGSVGVDYGGGKFDNGVEHMAEQDVTLVVYDPYNRTPEHNKEAIRTIRKNGGADFAICSNVLNVIKEAHIRKEVLENIKRLLKSSGKLYLTVYEGRGDNNEGETKSGYQLNRPTAGYLDEIREVFPDATRKGKLIVATPNGKPVESATEITEDSAPSNENQKDIVDKITNKVLEVMQGPHFGFPADEAKDYSRVEGYMKDGAFVIEVRAELSYDGMSELADELNPTIQELDRDAYFDMEEPGIMTAYLYSDTITSATYTMHNFPEPPLDPPEPKYEPEDLEEEVEFDFDLVVEVDSTGSWEYSEESLKDFEGDDGKWYGQEYPKPLRDADSMVEDFDTIIQEHIPAEAGTYRIKGTAKMVYLVEGYIPEHEEEGLDMQEAHSITFLDRQSEISDFSFETAVETSTDVKADAGMAGKKPNKGMHETYRDCRLPFMYDAIYYSNDIIVVDRDREGDSANYHWAKYNPDTEMWSIIKGTKVVKQIPMSDLEDGDVGEIAIELQELNKDIKPQKFGSGNKQIHSQKLSNGYIMRRYSQGQLQIDKPRPYDDADYHWAKFFENKNAWGIVFKGKVIHWMKEDCIEDLNAVSDMLDKYNKPIEPKMMHN